MFWRMLLRGLESREGHKFVTALKSQVNLSAFENSTGRLRKAFVRRSFWSVYTHMHVCDKRIEGWLPTIIGTKDRLM